MTALTFARRTFEIYKTYADLFANSEVVQLTEWDTISTMANIGKRKEKANEDESATAPSDNPIAGNDSANVAPPDAGTASPLKGITVSSDAPEEVTTSPDPAEASAGQAVPTGLPSETVEGPAPTAEVVNPLVLVVSIPNFPSQSLIIHT